MMAGLYAALAAQALAETEARLQAEEAARKHAAQVEQFNHIGQRVRAAAQRDVIDVEAREVVDAPAIE